MSLWEIGRSWRNLEIDSNLVKSVIKYLTLSHRLRKRPIFPPARWISLPFTLLRLLLWPHLPSEDWGAGDEHGSDSWLPLLNAG